MPNGVESTRGEMRDEGGSDSSNLDHAKRELLRVCALLQREVERLRSCSWQ